MTFPITTSFFGILEGCNCEVSLCLEAKKYESWEVRCNTTQRCEAEFDICDGWNDYGIKKCKFPWT